MFNKTITIPCKKLGDITVTIELNNISIQSPGITLKSFDKTNLNQTISDYASILSNPDNVTMLQDGKPWPKGQVENFITQESQRQMQGSLFRCFSVYKVDDSKFIGAINIDNVFEHAALGQGYYNAVEIGYFIHKDYWGQGYGTKMAILGKKYIQHLTLNYLEYHIPLQPKVIIATVHPDNIGSVEILKKTLKNKDPIQLTKFNGNPRVLFFKPLRLENSFHDKHDNQPASPNVNRPYIDLNKNHTLR